MALSKLKVALPLGTAITATAVTAYLIISTNNDLEKNKQADEALESLELTTKPFEEEIIKAEEESDEKENDSAEKEASKDKAQEAKEDEDKDTEEKQKSEAEPKDPKQALLDVEKDIKALVEAGGGANKLDIKIPEEAKIGQETQKAPIENKPSSEGGQPQSISEEEKLSKESGGDNLETPPASVPKETVLEASEDTAESSMGPESEDDSEVLEEQGLEAPQDLEQESISKEEQPLNGESDTGGKPEEFESRVAEVSENEDHGTKIEQQEGQASESDLGNRDQNNGTDDEDGGAQMTEEEIEELVALQGKMAEFSDRLSNLLQLRRFK